MESSPPDSGPFALLRAFIRELAAESPTQLRELLEALDLGTAGARQRTMDAALVGLRELEQAGPERWGAMLDALIEWVAGDDALEARLEPIVSRLSDLAASATIADVGAELDEIVMPWLEKLSGACVAAMMGDR